MIEVKLKRKVVNPKKKETAKEGPIEVIRVVLSGFDKVNDVEWSVALTHRGTELPKDYRKAMGKGWYDESFATLSAGAQQAELE